MTALTTTTGYVDPQIENLMQIYQDAFGDIADGRLVEVGAFNCYNWSNTYPLIKAGWSGLLIEPQPDRFEECRELYRDNERVILERCCVGKRNDTVRLYLGGSNSTIKRKMVDVYNEIEWSRISGLDPDKFIECELYTLDHLLQKHDWQPGFELLSIDVEGAEIDVLRGFSIDTYRPRLVIVETHELNEERALARKSRWINAYFERHHYQKIYTDVINSIYQKS